MRKTLHIIITVAFLTSLFTACSWTSKHQPINQVNTRWTCKELDIYFDIYEDYDEITGCKTYGQINQDNVLTEVLVIFDYGTNVTFFPVAASVTETSEGLKRRGALDGDMWLFIGKGKFSKNKCVLTVFNNEKGFLDDSVKTLTFIKSDIPKDELPDLTIQ